MKIRLTEQKKNVIAWQYYLIDLNYKLKSILNYRKKKKKGSTIFVMKMIFSRNYMILLILYESFNNE